MTEEGSSNISPEEKPTRDPSEEDTSGEDQRAILKRLQDAESKLDSRPSREWIYQRMGMCLQRGELPF